MKNILKSKKGISPILATLLLIVIAVAAVIVTYAWVMTFTESTTSQAGAVLKVDNVRFYNSGNNIEIIVRNSGTGDAQVDTVYAGTTASNLATQTDVTYSPTSQIVTAGSTLNVTITYDWTDGTTYHFKITTNEGFEIPFSREA
jgi:flagellin-like protein